MPFAVVTSYYYMIHSRFHAERLKWSSNLVKLVFIGDSILGLASVPYTVLSCQASSLESVRAQ